MRCQNTRIGQGYPTSCRLHMVRKYINSILHSNPTIRYPYGLPARAQVQVPAISFTEASSIGRTSVSTDVQQTEVRVPAKTNICSIMDARKKTNFADNLSDVPNADT